MSARKIFAGQKYGRLTIIRELEPTFTQSGRRRYKYLCKCECGNETIAEGGNLRKGLKKSCGCLEKENQLKPTHGKTNTRLFSIWVGMRRRCYDTRRNNYQNYGGRGIRVCNEWLGESGFQAFYDWAMANGYDDTLTIDRIDDDGNYEPCNCRWVDMQTQQNNRRNNHIVTAYGESMTVTQMARKYKLNPNDLYKRLKGKTNAESVIADLIAAE